MNRVERLGQTPSKIRLFRPGIKLGGREQRADFLNIDPARHHRLTHAHDLRQGSIYCLHLARLAIRWLRRRASPMIGLPRDTPHRINAHGLPQDFKIPVSNAGAGLKPARHPRRGILSSVPLSAVRARTQNLAAADRRKCNR